MKNNPKVTYRMPHCGLVLIFSIICSVVKILGGTSYDWIHVLTTIPICLYFLWTLGFGVVMLIMAVIGIKLSEFYGKENEKN